jgi:hypothetical protein
MAAHTLASPKQSNAHPVVVGVADHNGWAILVSAAAVNGEPTVIDRRRVPLIDKDVPNQPYHHETLGLPDTEAEELLRTVRRSIATRTAVAFDQLSSDLWPEYRVSAITIRQPPLEHLPATVEEVHRSYYTLCRADGMLYHSAICTAARTRDWDVVSHRRGEELARAAEALQINADDVERFLNDLRQTLRPPWTAEYRNAFAAAIGSLKQQSQLRKTNRRRT